MFYLQSNVTYSRITFPIKAIQILLSKTHKFRLLYLFSQTERKLQSKQYIFVA